MTPKLNGARSFLETVPDLDPVPCNGCTACCSGAQAVEIKPQYGDDPDQYEHKAIETLGGRMAVVLARKPNGDCIYLERDRCSIHDRRPAACRAFDCRRIYDAFDKQQRREAVARGVFSKRIFEAGKERLGTMKLLDEEKPVQAMMADFLLTRARGINEG